MLFFDGAFGTYYMSKRSGSITGNCELANLRDKPGVLAVHREYIESGANAVKTNTFRANPEIFPDGGTLRQIITEGYVIACRAAESAANAAGARNPANAPSGGAASHSVKVFADIGPVSDETLCLSVAEIFLEAGAVNFLFETLPGFNGIAEAAALIKRRVKNSTVIVSFAVSMDGYSAKGLHYKQLISQAAACENVDAVGLNCVSGPSHLLNLAKSLPDVSKPLAVMPNAGYPAVIDGRLNYNDNAEYFGERLLEISRLGVTILGGCCGTTPAHIKQAISRINAASKEAPRAKRAYKAEGTLKAKDARPKLKRKPIYAELDPPPGSDFSKLLAAADRFRRHGAEAITLADSPLSRPRTDSVLAAVKLKTEKHADVIPHITCRDKNSIALRGSLLGAYAFGIDKVLAVTGDRMTENGASKDDSVFSFNSISLISYINNLNKELFSERPFTIGGALNVNAPNFGAELKRAAQKAASGAGFLLTQAIFSEEAVRNLITARKELDCKLFAGILPLAGYKNAVFLNNEVAGMRIPQAVIDSLEGKENPASVAIDFCAEIIKSVYDYADGFYIMTPFNKAKLVCDLIEECFYE